MRLTNLLWIALLLALAYGLTSSNCWNNYNTEVTAITYCENHE